MTRTDPPMRIRLPEALKETIQTLAKKNRRSMNAEIIARLEATLSSGDDGGGQDGVEEKLTAILQELKDTTAQLRTLGNRIPTK